MKTGLTLFTAVALVILAGCHPAVQNKELLTVDFQKAQTLRYEFVSSRVVAVDWGATKAKNQSEKNEIDKHTESLQTVVSYTPIEVDFYGLTTIEAVCESAKVSRTKSVGRQGATKDAAESLAGKTFTFTVGPSGKIEDYSQLEKLVRQAGENAFQPESRRGKIKDPDMVGDFITSQWFLWDSISSIEKPLDGIKIGQSWKSQISVPAPMVLQQARDVTYTFSETRQTANGRVAVIKSSYSLPKSALRKWPLPYPDGSFFMSGKFGFLRNYKALNLQGSGEELFNIEAGRIEEYYQNYQVEFEASLPIALNVSPKITIEQYLTMKLLPQQNESEKVQENK